MSFDYQMLVSTAQGITLGLVIQIMGLVRQFIDLILIDIYLRQTIIPT